MPTLERIIIRDPPRGPAQRNRTVPCFFLSDLEREAEVKEYRNTCGTRYDLCPGQGRDGCPLYHLSCERGASGKRSQLLLSNSRIRGSCGQAALYTRPTRSYQKGPCKAGVGGKRKSALSAARNTGVGGPSTARAFRAGAEFAHVQRGSCRFMFSYSTERLPFLSSTNVQGSLASVDVDIPQGFVFLFRFEKRQLWLWIVEGHFQGAPHQEDAKTTGQPFFPCLCETSPPYSTGN